MDQLTSVWIGYYRSRLVNISLDGLNVKKVSVNIGKDGLISVKCWLRLTDINRYLDRIILTNYRLRMTKTGYVKYEI